MAKKTSTRRGTRGTRRNRNRNRSRNADQPDLVDLLVLQAVEDGVLHRVPADGDRGIAQSLVQRGYLELVEDEEDDEEVLDLTDQGQDALDELDRMFSSAQAPD